MDGIGFHFASLAMWIITTKDYLAHLAQKFNIGFFLQPFIIILIHATIINVRNH